MNNALAQQPVEALLRLDGRTAIVTGAATGIGKAIALRLAQAGAATVIADVDGDAARITAAELERHGYEALAADVDVSNETEAGILFLQASAWRPRLDILVNNAGIFPSTPTLEMSMAEYDRVLGVNLRGAMMCAQQAGQHMRNQGRGGSIINITSIDALHPSATGLAHYDASKHGLWGLTTNLALELASANIRVNAIAPGAIDAPGAAQQISDAKDTVQIGMPSSVGSRSGEWVTPTTSPHGAGARQRCIQLHHRQPDRD